LQTKSHPLLQRFTRGGIMRFVLAFIMYMLVILGGMKAYERWEEES